MKYFFIKHARKIQLIILTIAIVLSFCYCAFVKISAFPFAISFLVTIIFSLTVNLISNYIAKKKCLRFQSSCDPAEYLEFIEILYKSNPNNIVYTLDYCTMLVSSNSDNYLVAKGILERFDLTPFSSKLYYPMLAIYYNNLCDIYMSLGELDKACEAYENELKYFSYPESQKGFKPHLFSTLALTTAELCSKKGDYDKALEEIEKHNTNDLCESVKHAFVLGSIYMGMSEKEKATEQLEYVIENGNKLSLVDKAKELLQQMS